jgi:hypothetical protein
MTKAECQKKAAAATAAAAAANATGDVEEADRALKAAQRWQWVAKQHSGTRAATIRQWSVSFTNLY